MKNILVFYNGNSLYTPTVKDYIQAFSRYSHNNIHYLHVGHNTEISIDLNAYDALFITYSCRLCYPQNWPTQIWEGVAEFNGLKVAFIQDEYQETNKIREALRILDIKLVFTCVPEDKINWVYPREMFPDTRFVRVLTGYVTAQLKALSKFSLPPIGQRPYWLGYRGRSLGHCWGDLAFFKQEIGKRFKTACLEANIPHDIEWTEEKRIYQEQWYAFIANSRTTIGSPSGTNIFDWSGELEQEYRHLIQKKPTMLYEEYRPKIAVKEEEIDMGQISPRMFECIALRSALVLLEGNYSGILEPNIHYIEVKRDFSNIKEVLEKIKDLDYLENLTKFTYEDIIETDKWSYQNFIKIVDKEVDKLLFTSETIFHATPVLKPYDQQYFEEQALTFPKQLPLHCCLDLSHLRTSNKSFLSAELQHKEIKEQKMESVSNKNNPFYALLERLKHKWLT